MLFFKIPDIENDNYVNHKFILFISLFIFTFITQIIAKIRNGCKIDQMDVANKSLQVAVTAIIGYSLYVDFNVMEWSKDYVASLVDSKYSLYLLVAIIMILFIAIIKIVQLLFENEISGNC